MKKILVSIICFLASMFSMHAQILYGTTIYGGSDGTGTIVKFIAATNNLSVVKSFEDTGSDGRYPYNSLIQASNGKIYGTTIQGGSDGNGIIFSLDPSSSEYTKLKDFYFDDGQTPNGSLMQSGDGKLYGMTGNGGINDGGVIFSFDPYTSTFTKQKDFYNPDGSNPNGGLIEAGDGKLYGMTTYGGTGDNGVIFSFDPFSATYTKLKDFNDSDGRNPQGSLIQASNGKLYGMTSYGGESDAGVIFSFDIFDSIYTKLIDFDIANGSGGFGSLMQASDGKLYGMTTYGGSGNVGILFSFDPSNAVFTKLKDFDYGEHGGYSFSSLMQASDGKLYGMTFQGGSGEAGVIFSFDLSSSTYTKLKNFDGSNGGYPISAFIELKGSSPSVSLITPIDSTTYYAGQNIYLTAAALDSDGTITKVQFYKDSTLLYTSTVAPYIYLWQNVDSGNYVLTAKATDNSGLVTASAQVHISVVPNQPPAVSMISPANGSYPAPVSLRLTAQASDADGTIQKVEFYNGTIRLATKTSLPYSWIWKDIPLGNYVITAKATDNLGAITTSAPITIAVVPNQPPLVDITEPVNNASYPAPASIRLTAKAKDTDGTIKKVQFYNGTTLLATKPLLPYTWVWNNVPAGNYVITAKATDNRGAVTTSAEVYISVVPNQPPTVSMTSPANGSYPAPVSLRLTATASDADGAIQKVEFYNDTIRLATKTSLPYSWIWKDIPLGSYIITAKATDNLGNVTISAPINISIVPNQPPLVDITEPANNTAYPAPASIRLTAKAKDTDGTIKKVQFYNGTTLLATKPLLPYSWVWNNVPAGTYTITAKATDNRDAVTTSAPVYLVVVPNQTPALSKTRPTDGFAIDNALSLQLAPNPAKNTLNIYTTGLQMNKHTTLSVISSTGVTMKTMKLAGSAQTIPLDVSSLVSGMYTVKLVSGDKVMYRKFVKL